MAAAVDPVSLGKRYHQQLSQTAATVHGKAMVIKEQVDSVKTQLDTQREQLQPQLMAMIDGYKATIQDVESPPPANAAPFLLKSYLWSGVCLFMFSVARIVSGMFFFGVLGMFFDTWVATVLTFVVFPAFVYMVLRKVQMSEVEREQVVLFAAVVEGVLMGMLLSDRHLSIIGPPIFLLPVCMGLAAHYTGPLPAVAGNRRAFVGALVGGGMIGYVLFGFVFNFNSTYMVSMAILGGAAFADLQLKCASIQRGDSSPQLEQWKTVVMMTIAGAVSHYLASSTSKRTAQVAQKKGVIPAK